MERQSETPEIDITKNASESNSGQPSNGETTSDSATSSSNTSTSDDQLVRSPASSESQTRSEELDSGEQDDSAQVEGLQSQLDTLTEELESLRYVLRTLRDGSEHAAQVLLDDLRSSPAADVRTLARSARDASLGDGAETKK